jgi:predicted dehydrogenase
MKAALVGMGPHGRRVLQALAKLEGVELVGVVDRRQTALAEVPEGVGRHPDLASLFDAGTADLVCIATNGPSHAELAVEAMARGARFLMVEKPMACSLAECDRMRDTALARGARLAVDHPRRYTTVYRWVRQNVLAGRWGEPRAMWIQRPGIGLGCLGTHSFDLARFVTGLEARRVTAWVDEPLGPNPRGEDFVDPGGLVVLEMERGLRAVVAQVEDGSGPMSVELDLTAARLRIDEKSGEVELIERDLSVKKGPDRPAAYQKTLGPEGLTAVRDLEHEIRLLLADLVGGGAIDADIEHGTRSIEILVAAHLSQRAGNQPIALPLSDPEQRKVWLPVT